MKSLSFLHQNHITSHREQRCTKNGKYVPTGNHFIAQSNTVPVCSLYHTLVTMATTTNKENMWIQLFSPQESMKWTFTTALICSDFFITISFIAHRFIG